MTPTERRRTPATGATAQSTARRPPTDAPPTGPPPRDGVRRELRALAQPARLLLRTPALTRAPRGDGRVVIDVPGWRAPEQSMAPLRWYLRRLGHAARPWGLGTNEGDPERDAERLEAIVREEVATTGEPVALVGWSLGGTIAREVARRAPDQVRHVVTYGTPAVGGPTHTLGAAAWGAAEAQRIATMQEQLDREDPIQVPITAVFTRQDTVVSWLACLDHTSPDVDHVEVRSTHLGLGLDPDVWLAAARALAADTH